MGTYYIMNKRCFKCKKKIKSILPISCKCDNYYCKNHKYTDEHDCTFDYKNEHKTKLVKDNKKVEHHKFVKLE